MPKKNPELVKSETLTIKIAPQLKERLLDAATARALDMSTLARMLITEGLNGCDEKRWGPHKKRAGRSAK